MSPDEAERTVRSWLTSERIEIREQEDPRAQMHLLVKYPQGKNGHMFAIVIPKGRDLLAISSMTRVDEGQQKSMRDLMKTDDEEWRSWMHECRMQLIASGATGAFIWATPEKKDQAHYKHSMLANQFGLMV